MKKIHSQAMMHTLTCLKNMVQSKGFDQLPKPQSYFDKKKEVLSWLCVDYGVGAFVTRITMFVLMELMSCR